MWKNSVLCTNITESIKNTINYFWGSGSVAGYYKSTNGQYCPSGEDLMNEEVCIEAATSLGLNYETAWYGLNSWHYCLFADDGRSTVYFNTAGENTSPTPITSNYASLCMSPSNNL